MTTIAALLALDVETLRNGAVAAIVVVVLLGLLAVKLFVNMVVRVITVAIVVALGVGIWSQRESLQECADQVGDAADLSELDAGDIARGSITCTFFGVEVDVPIPVPGA